MTEKAPELGLRRPTHSSSTGELAQNTETNLRRHMKELDATNVRSAYYRTNGPQRPAPAAAPATLLLLVQGLGSGEFTVGSSRPSWRIKLLSQPPPQAFPGLDSLLTHENSWVE